MLRTLAFTLVMCTGFTAGIFSRYYALLFYLWFAVFRPQEWVWIDVEQFRFSLLIGLLLVLPALATGVLPNLTHPISLGMISFLVTALIGQMSAFNPAVGWERLDLLTRIVVVSLFMVTLVDTRERFVQVVAVIAGSLAFHAAKFGVSFFIWGGVRFDSGIGGAFGGNNEFALAIARVVFLLLIVVQNFKSGFIRLGFLAAIPLSCIGLVSTYSRGAFVALAAGVMVYVLLQRRLFRSLIVVAGILLLVVTYVPIPQAYFERLGTIRTYDETEERSALSRLHFWKVALVIAKDNPTGIGLRNFEYAYDTYDFSDGEYQTGRSVHNSHLQALVETGYLGFAVWAFLFGCLFWTAFKVRRLSFDTRLDSEVRRFYFTSANALIASTTAFVVGGTFAAEVLSDLNWFTFGLAAALGRLAVQDMTVAEPAHALPLPQAWSPQAIASAPAFSSAPQPTPHQR